MLLNGFYGRFNQRRVEQIDDLAHKTILLDRRHGAILRSRFALRCAAAGVSPDTSSRSIINCTGRPKYSAKRLLQACPARASSADGDAPAKDKARFGLLPAVAFRNAGQFARHAASLSAARISCQSSLAGTAASTRHHGGIGF
jgi:hypothetical protein